MSRGALMLLCGMVLLVGEAGVLLTHGPVTYALGIALVCAVLGWVSWWQGDSTHQPRGDASFESFIAEMKDVCPWMTGKDVKLLRQAFASLFPPSRGEEDLDGVAQAALRLTERACLCHDERRAFAFWQRYQEVRAWQQGREYTWFPLPEALEEV